MKRAFCVNIRDCPDWTQRAVNPKFFRILFLASSFAPFASLR